jgi:DNA polymerase-3 subunit delta'
MAFADVLGHEGIRGLLSRALVAGRVPHALLFAGPEGVGKRTLALAFAGALLCDSPGPEGACGACSHCRRVARALAGLDELRAGAERGYRGPEDAALFDFRLHPDLVLVEPPTRGGRRAEILAPQAEDIVRQTFKPPFEARARVFVIDDAHALCSGSSVSAANALLKSLEEPPPRSYFVLVTAQPYSLLATVRSRCQTLRFGALSTAAVCEGLRREGVAEPEARLRAALSGGSLGRALAFDSEAWRDQRRLLLGLLEEAPGLETLGRLRAAERLKELDDVRGALTALRTLLRDVAALHAGARPAALLNADLDAPLAALARGPLGPRAVELAEAAAEARAALAGYAHEQLTLDGLVERLAAQSVES